MIKIAPELFSPVVHTCWKDEPERHLRHEKKLVRERMIAAKWKPIDYAYNYVRSNLRDGSTLQRLLDRMGVSSTCYVKIAIGTFMGAPAGKIKVEMWDGQKGIFSIRDLVEKIDKEKKQKTLF